MRTHVRPGSIIVSDKRLPARKAIAALGYRAPPAMRHTNGWHDRQTGFHSNDGESENDCLEAWARLRYSRLQLTEEDMHEYAFYVNVGKAIADVCGASRR